MPNLAARRSIALAIALSAASLAPSVHAGTALWDNGAGNLLWDTTSPNWSGSAWNNAAKNVAYFDLDGIGPITVASPVTAHAIGFGMDGYTFAGPGTITLAAGTGNSVPVGTVFVSTGSVPISAPIVSSVGMTKTGAGTLELGGSTTITGNLPMFGFGFAVPLSADISIGSFGLGDSGTVKIVSPAALSPSARVGIGYGTLNIGTGNTTVGELTFMNITHGLVLGGDSGTGTLHVTGEINVIGKSDPFQGNTIAANLNLDGKAQVFRIGNGHSFALNDTLMVRGVISNGSVYKTIGYEDTGLLQSGANGFTLLGNNTYAGETKINGGNSVFTGTNATTSANFVNAYVSLMGENGSMQSVPVFKVSMDGGLILDSNSGIPFTGPGGSPVPAGYNGDRISDSARVELRSGILRFSGFDSNPSSETFGSLHVLTGDNEVTVRPNNGGTAILTATGSLNFGARATLKVLTDNYWTGNASNALGGNAQFKVNGSIPAADATGLIPRMITGTNYLSPGGANFVTYNAANGFTPFTAYVNDFSTTGANVSLVGATTLSASQTINALRLEAAVLQNGNAGSLTTTIDAGNVLSVSSGMILNAAGGQTISGAGTLAFGARPGVLFGPSSNLSSLGTLTIATAITGSDGIINSQGAATLSGNLSGLSGRITINSGILSLTSSTFTGPIDVLSGVFRPSGTEAPGGADIRLGNPDNDVDMLGSTPAIDLSAGGANAVFNRNVIVDNVTQKVGGKDLPTSALARISPLSNGLGSQTFNGNLTLNTSLNFQGGAASGSGATVFNGAISGPGLMCISNGRVIFSPTSTISNSGGFIVVPSGGWAGQATFLGTSTSTGPISITGSTTGTLNFIAYQSSASLPSGTITFLMNGGIGSYSATVIPLGNSTINNPFNVTGDGAGSVGTSITATWAGDMTGAGMFSKQGAGTLILSGSSASRTGNTVLVAGTLQLNNDGTKSAWAPVLTNPGGADVRGGRLSFAYSDSATSPAATIKSLLTSSYNAVGKFTNTANRIRSTTSNSSIGLGWLDTGLAVVVGYTYYGDSDLNGKVNTVDFNYLAASFGQSGKNWIDGDYNYNGIVDSTDFGLLLGNYGKTMAIPAPMLGSLVPEPGSLAVLVAAAPLMTRRRRMHH